MKTIYLLLGEANARKSSVVRCLLGVGRIGMQVEVQSMSGLTQHIRALVCAAQEKSLTPKELLGELNTFRWDGKFLNIRNALVPLRYDLTSTKGIKYPQAEDYVTALLEDGWIIKGCVSLGEEARDWLKNSGLPYISIPNSRQMPGNAVAAIVRKAFDWV